MKKYKQLFMLIIMTLSTLLVLFSDRMLYLESYKSIFSSFNSNLIISSISMIIIYMIYKKYIQMEYDKKVSRASLFLATLFSLSEIIGFYLTKTHSFFNYYMNIYTIIYNILLFCGWLSILYILLRIIINFLLEKSLSLNTKDKYSFFTNNRKSIFTVALFLIILWIGYYYIFYSGIVTNDSYYQIIQGLGYMPLTNEHPFLHTIIEGLIVKLGVFLFGDINSGVALCSFVQMCLIAFIISYIIKYLAYKKVNYKIRLLVLCFYGLHPVIALYSITLWKDVWMGIFNLTYIIILYEMCTNINQFLKNKKRILLLLLNMLLILFSKGTGIIIIVISFVPILFVFKMHLKKLSIILVSSIVIFFGVNTVSQKVFNIKSGHIREPLSVPIQQIARTIKYHYNDLNDNEKDTLNEIFPIDKLGELYNPVLSDDTKRELNEDAFKKNPFRYIGVWFTLGVKHPLTYIDSFLANSFGYWYPETSYWIVFTIDYLDRLEYFKEAWSDVKYDENYLNYKVDESKIEIKNDIVNMVNQGIRKIPIVGCLFSIGFYFWVDLVFLVIIFLKKQYKLLPIHFTIFATFLICIGSPVYAEFRYAYPSLTTLPFIIIFSIINKSRLNS